MTPLTFEPRGIPRAIAASLERDSVRGECVTSTCLRWARKVDGRGAWQLPNLTQPRQADLPPSPVSNHAPPNNDDKTTTPLPFPPREFVHAPATPATRPTSQRNAPTRAGSSHVSAWGLGRSRGGLGLGPRVLEGVAVG